MDEWQLYIAVYIILLRKKLIVQCIKIYLVSLRYFFDWLTLYILMCFRDVLFFMAFKYYLSLLCCRKMSLFSLCHFSMPSCYPFSRSLKNVKKLLTAAINKMKCKLNKKYCNKTFWYLVFLKSLWYFYPTFNWNI